MALSKRAVNAAATYLGSIGGEKLAQLIMDKTDNSAWIGDAAFLGKYAGAIALSQLTDDFDHEATQNAVKLAVTRKLLDQGLSGEVVGDIMGHYKNDDFKPNPLRNTANAIAQVAFGQGLNFVVNGQERNIASHLVESVGQGLGAQMIPGKSSAQIDKEADRFLQSFLAEAYIQARESAVQPTL